MKPAGSLREGETGHTSPLKDVNRISLTKPSIFKVEIEVLLNILALTSAWAAHVSAAACAPRSPHCLLTGHSVRGWSLG